MFWVRPILFSIYIHSTLTMKFHHEVLLLEFTTSEKLWGRKRSLYMDYFLIYRWFKMILSMTYFNLFYYIAYLHTTSCICMFLFSSFNIFITYVLIINMWLYVFEWNNFSGHTAELWICLFVSLMQITEIL